MCNSRCVGWVEEGARRLARSAGASPAQVRRSEPPGGECCVSRRQRGPRSVHSCCMGCVIEPRNILVAGGGDFLNGRTQHGQDRYATTASAMERPNPRWEPYAGKLHVRICAGGGEQSPSLPRPKRNPSTALEHSKALEGFSLRSTHPTLPSSGHTSPSLPRGPTGPLRA